MLLNSVIFTEVPVFVMGIDKMTIVEGKPAQFKCVVNGQPEPRVKWQVIRGNYITGSMLYFCEYICLD